MKLIPHIRSQFFTMDIAKKKDGDWLIVELGDGQVSGLPENADRGAFYRALGEFKTVGVGAIRRPNKTQRSPVPFQARGFFVQKSW